MSALLPEFTVLFQPASTLSLHDQLRQLFEFRHCLASWGPAFETWYLGGDTKEEALMYEAFDQHGVTTAAYAVLKTRNGGKETADDIGLWNGHDGASTAGLGYLLGAPGRPWTVNFRPRVDPTVTTQHVMDVMQCAVRLWRPDVVTAHPPAYMTKKSIQRPARCWCNDVPSKGIDRAACA